MATTKKRGGSPKKGGARKGGALAPREIEVTDEGAFFTVRIPKLARPRPSGSGKTIIDATSGGNVRTGVQTDDGDDIFIGVNMYHYADN